MDTVYRDLENTASLASISKLKKLFPDKNDVESFLHSKDSYTLHKITRKKFHRRRFITKSPGDTICVDVAYMKNYEKANKGFGYMMVFIDIFSRYLSVFMLKSLKSSDVISVMDKFLTSSIYKYRKLISDEGVEFTSKKIRELFHKHKICQYSTYNREIKASPSERVIRTIKNKIAKFITEFNSEVFIDVLPQIVSTYNITPHRGIGYKSPLQVHLINTQTEIADIFKLMYKNTRKIDPSSLSNVLQPGQDVRLVNTRVTQSLFTKADVIQNTTEIFKVDKVNFDHSPITYNVIDLDGEPIKGRFYREELIPVKDCKRYKIEVLKKRKRNKSIELYVKFVDYPSSKPEWIKQNQLVD